MGRMARRMLELSENDHGAWERSGMLRAFKAYPATKEMHIAVRQDKIMPPNGIRPGRKKADHPRTLLGFDYGFFNPLSDCAAIGRVHPTSTVPRLEQPIHIRAEKALAFCIVRGGAHIKREWAI